MRLRRIVVTGGTGFLGRCVIRALQDAGFEPSSCSRAEGIDLRDGVAFGKWLNAVRPDVIVHCAAHVGGIGYVQTHAAEVFQDNLAIASGLMEGVQSAGVDSVITIMPNCTYPGNKDIYKECEWWDGPIHESVLMYGLPRKTLWGLCKTFGDTAGLQSAHLILPNLYGPGDHLDPAKSHALGALMSKIVIARRDGAPTVELWGSGRPVREWLFVEDAASAVVRFLQKAGEDNSIMERHSIFNVGIGQGISVAELAELIREIAGWKGSFVFDRSRPDGAMQKRLDGRRFEQLTGWTPAVSLRAGIAQTLSWFETALARECVHAH